MRIRRWAVLGTVGAVLVAPTSLSAAGRGPAAAATYEHGTAAAPRVEERAACPAFGGRLRVGSPGLKENSGLAASRRRPRVVWAHNDSGHPERVFALNARTGRVAATFTVSDSRSHDWEDIAIGPGPAKDRDFLYVGDFGSASRHARAIIRIPEPRVDPHAPHSVRRAKGVRRFRFRYPGGASYNAEALMFDPGRRRAFVVTKDYRGRSKVFLYPKPFDPTVRKTLVEVVSRLRFNVGSGEPNDRLVTAADISPNRSEIVIKTYNQTYVWRLGAAVGVSTALRWSRCQITDPGTSEAITYSASTNRLFSLGEGARSSLYYVRRR